MRRCRVFNLLGDNRLVDFTQAWRYQRALLESMHLRKKAGEKDVTDAALLLQHHHVYTLGRGADEANVLTRQLAGPLVRVERGGEVTYHGPGQLVVYPVLDLDKHKRDLHWYVRCLEETVIRTLAEHGLVGERSAVNSGVWVGMDKVCAVGVTASRWITMHGLALNVNCDLERFEDIVPCGIREPGRGVTSMRQLMSVERVDINAVAETLQRNFARLFQYDQLLSSDEGELESLLRETSVVPREVNIGVQ